MFINVAQAAAENSSGIAVLGLNLKMFIAQLVNFGLIMLVLWKLAYKPLLKVLDDRAAKVAKGVADAEAATKLKAGATTEKLELLKTARVEAARIIDEAGSKAAELRESTIISTKAEVAKVVAAGRAELGREKEQMIGEVVKESKTLLASAVLKIAGVKIDDKKDAELIKESLT